MFETLHRTMQGNDTLKIRCEVCHHTAVWSRIDAFERLGPDASPYEVRRKLRCSECSTKARMVVWV